MIYNTRSNLYADSIISYVTDAKMVASITGLVRFYVYSVACTASMVYNSLIINRSVHNKKPSISFCCLIQAVKGHALMLYVE